MQLSFEYSLNAGEGHHPCVIHDRSNLFRVIYFDDDDLAMCYQTDPVLGLYDDLEYEDYGRISPDYDITHPSLKKVAHYGAYGFWSAMGDHRFVIYMMPTDISRTLIDGNISFNVSSAISSLSCNLVNVRGELLNRYRALVTPGTKLEVYFSLGSSGETPLGVFFIDHANVSYPDEKVSITARNAVGKLLKDQTFDENCIINKGSVQENIKEILKLAEIERYFVGDALVNNPFEFKPETTMLEGINYGLNYVSNWKLAETLDGRVGVAHVNDVRFDIPSTYTFERDKTCWSYSYEYDDADAASRVCVFSKGENEEDPTVRAYANVTFNKWWSQPTHRTLHVETVKGSSLAQVTALAQTLAASVADSGRLESFVGVFTPQLIINDEIKVIDDEGNEEVIGSVTDVKHTFGRNGFYTSFAVDSGGRRGRVRLKDLIDVVSSAPQEFTGVQEETQDGDNTEY